MNLLVRFSLVFIAVFAPGLAIVGYFSWHFLQSNAEEQVRQQASIMMDTALAVRRYTAAHIQPIVSGADVKQTKFYPESVPAFAATEVFLDLRGSAKDYADYFYKEAVLNPTNPRDQARGWEEDIVNEFRSHPDRKQIAGERAGAMGNSLYLAHPLVVGSKEQCLTCHGVRDDAPPQMIKAYSLEGSANGFGWQEGETIGAQIVSVPVSKPFQVAQAAFRELMVWLILGGLLTLAILDASLYFAVIRPIKRVADSADATSRGDLSGAELPETGPKEISVLAAAFNRMHRSLEKAMKLIDGQ